MTRPRVLLLAACALLAGCWQAGPAAAARPRPPVVMIVFDEFSTISLLDSRGRIDAARYPSFARLARDATWYPYATASLDETGRAIRSLFTSSTPWRWLRPNYANHPHNLFTLLGRKYRMEASEEASSFCPKRLCPNVRPQTQGSIEAELSSGRPERFLSWTDKLVPSKRPTFYLKHTLLPHAPWLYLPSGHIYSNGPSEAALPADIWKSDPWLIRQVYQRHLLQVEFTDSLVGRALNQLQANGLYDRSMIVVTADNGESFGRPGYGHLINRRNVSDIALTPLIVKLPFQRAGRIDRRHARTVDVVPTIARVARLRPDWRLEGFPLFGAGTRKIPSVTIMRERSGHRIRLSLRNLRRRSAEALRLKLRLFGSGDSGPGLYGIGPHPELVGTPAASWQALPAGSRRADLDNVSRFGNVSLDSPPVKLTGRLAGAQSTAPLDMAIDVNGTIVATAPAIAPRQGAPRIFSVLIPESSLRDGENAVQLFAIEPGPALRPLGGT
jgi:Sulfatase